MSLLGIKFACLPTNKGCFGWLVSSKASTLAQGKLNMAFFKKHIFHSTLDKLIWA